MSASVADILRSSGFVPTVPSVSPPDGDAETLVPQRVPTVPTCPQPKTQGRDARSIEPSHCTRANLLELAKLEGIAPGLVHALTHSDLIECTGLPDRVLRTYLHAITETADRMAGRVPADETAAILCRKCGPVWAHPAIAEALPKVDGWPRALGCQWCHVRAAGRTIQRPPVTCAGCRHYRRDKINPAAGFGSCAAGHGPHYPNEPHRCASVQTRFGCFVIRHKQSQTIANKGIIDK